MKIIYGTTNKSKIDFMRRRINGLGGIEMLSLNDVSMPKVSIMENGATPLENARIKALSYFAMLGRPVFSCDSGLYIDNLDDSRQPGLNIRGAGDVMNDDEAIVYYSKLAEEMGGKMTARYKNAICLVMAKNKIFEHMGDDIASEPFIITSKPHPIRKEGFPLDSLSIDIASGKYFHDLPEENSDKLCGEFAAFFKRSLNL
ncbi:MAG: hypothetical protein FWD01_01580 [Defluviitaleaceae bacterium]|nr:hypothetical protein [Defluviitaleaceae bacterium]